MTTSYDVEFVLRTDRDDPVWLGETTADRIMDYVLDNGRDAIATTDSLRREVTIRLIDFCTNKDAETVRMVARMLGDGTYRSL